MADTNLTIRYNKGTTANPSSIDSSSNRKAQIITNMFLRKALEEEEKERYFLPLASSISLPKHYGKKIIRLHYLPVLDDRNQNDQGIDATGAYYEGGNLYGSSRDIGKIEGALPVLDENGGRKNRIGFTRKTVKGTIATFGYFYEYTEEAEMFDSDKDLMRHLTREAVRAAHQMTEAQLQIDLLNAAGVVVYPGSATADDEISADVMEPSVVDLESLRRLTAVLIENRCPLQTKMITGVTNIDTRTIDGGFVAYTSADVIRLLEDMVDAQGNSVWVPVYQYAAARKPLHGEMGSIGKLRFVQVPEMLRWEGAGAKLVADDDNKGYHASPSKEDPSHIHYDVFPILVVGDDSFNTIGFQYDGTDFKFRTIHKAPGEATASALDPYGAKGFFSLKYWYGFLCNRPERIAVLKTLAPL